MALPFAPPVLPFLSALMWLMCVKTGWWLLSSLKGLPENVVCAMLLGNSLGLDDAVPCGDVVGNVE